MKDPQSSGGFFALMVAHDGLALFVRKRNQAHLVRLSDGMGWILNAEPGTDFARPLGITDEHVMLFTAKQICPTCTVQRQDSLIRFSRAALGPPTEPNGL
jgi:hypothetical protein